MINIYDVISKKDQKAFIMLPFRLYKNNKQWVPPIINDEYKIFSLETNPALAYCDSCFWIAEKDNKVVGRIGAIINHRYNEKIGEKIGRFSRFECIDDFEVGSKLLATAENWLKQKGMTKVHGPLGFTNLDLQGLLIRGFEYIPSIASVYHLPYYKDIIEKCGYEKENDWLEFRLTLESNIPEKVTRMVDLIRNRYKLRTISFKKKKELLPYANELFELLNVAFDELPYVSEFDDKTKTFYTNKYFNFLNPEFVKVIIDSSDKMCGFIVGLPSLSLAMQKCNGKLFPFGFIHVLRALKRPKEMDLLLTGVDPHLQGQGVPALLINELQQVLIKHKIKHVETTGIFETNQKAIQTWKNYENIQHKQRRCFIKQL